MRLRTQFGLLTAASLVLALVLLGASTTLIRKVQDAGTAADTAREVLREARGMLVLSHEAARDRQERATQQWQAHHRGVVAGLAAARSTDVGDAPDADVDAAIAALPSLFEALLDTGRAPAGDALAGTRREMLVDLLVTETQAVLDAVNRWGVAVDAERLASERRLAVLAVLGPALMALPLAAMGWLMAARVLTPVDRLQQTMARVEAGDLQVRILATRDDELGDLKRAFTRMTESLEASTRRLADNEQRLRLVTDHLPARVSHYALDDRCTFANRPFCETWGYRDPSEVIGRTSAELLPAALYASLQPRIVAAKAGQPQFFVVSLPAAAGRRQHHEFAMVPDHDADGRAQGVYVMARDVTERVEAEARIEAALYEKEALLKEVHHRVKNNMQIISSLLQLQSGAIQSAPVRALLAESQDRIRSMALIHEKLYQSAEFARVDFADYVHGLLAMLSAAHGNPARLDVQAEPVWLGIDQAVPAGLILNELVTNSFKHAFPGGRAGRIAVSFEALPDERVCLRVADDGVGPPAGYDPATGGTLGLRLVRILADQLDAEVAFDHGAGFDCRISFQLAPTATPGVDHG